MYDEERRYEVVDDIDHGSSYRRANWELACGLQAADGLRVSGYAMEQGDRYVLGELDSRQLVEEVERHYEDSVDPSKAEADIVSARIARMLETASFALEPQTLFVIHRSLFDGVLPDEWVGVSRQVNLSKAEPVLGGRSVTYADWSQIHDKLEYDFEAERARVARSPLTTENVGRLARFVANVWQTHAFREGNTRTVATFTELYLRSLGCDVDNEPFARNSTYFRDALVRASFSDLSMGILEDRSFLTSLLSNVALGTRVALDPASLNLHGVREGDLPCRGSNKGLESFRAIEAENRAEDGRGRGAGAIGTEGHGGNWCR